jgi:hypothetical protein
MQAAGTGTRFKEGFFDAAYAAAFCFSIYFHFAQGYGGDKNWRLLATKLWLEGRPLYRGTFFDINMPFIVWVYALPVKLAQMLGLPDFLLLTAFGLLAAAGALYVSMRVIAFHPQFKDDPKERRLFAMLLVFIFIIATSPASFFERDYNILLFTLPYSLSLMPSLRQAALPRGLRWAIGLLAGFGFCMKPHSALLFMGLQIWLFIRERSFRPMLTLENAIIGTIVLMYLTAACILTPEYFRIVLPMVLATYAACGRQGEGLVFFFTPYCFMLCVAFVDFRPKSQTPYRADLYYFLYLTAIFCVYALVNNGWVFTYHPFGCMVLLVTGWAAWDYRYLKESQGLSSKSAAFGMRACLLNLFAIALFTVWGFYAALQGGCDTACGVDRMMAREIAQKDGSPRSFGTMSSVFGRFIDLERQTGARYETRFHHLWMLPKFFAEDTAYARSHRQVLDYIAAAYAQDLEARKPKMMFVDDNDGFFIEGRFIGLVDYFSAWPAFASAWKFYRYDHLIDYCIYSKTPAHHKPYRMGDRSVEPPGCRFLVYLRQ